ncbi:hypothetical protein N9Y42_00750 [Mariniblastus sp.]|nr:hypothetical protein [Mariniblastus sp.]
MRPTLVFSTLLILFLPLNAQGQVAANLILAEGHPWGGSTVESVNPPFVNGLGQVGFNAILADGSISIVFDGEQRLNFASDIVTGAESSVGFGNAGQFIFGPISPTGTDSVRNQNGLLLVANTQAPGFDPGVISTFHSGATITDDGTAYWSSGFDDGLGEEFSEGKMLYRRTPDGSIDVVVRSGDVIDGETIDGRRFDVGLGRHKVSRNNANLMFIFTARDGNPGIDYKLSVNQKVVAATGELSGDGDVWGYFDLLTINNAGNYAFSGETIGFSLGDDFIAYNGDIQLRENDRIAQGTLVGGAFAGLSGVGGVQLNESNELAFTWNLDDGSGVKETLFFASDASDLSNLDVVASVGDEIDTNGDGFADWILADFNSSSNRSGIGLTEEGTIYVEVELGRLDGSDTTVEAIVSFPIAGSGFLLGDVNRDNVVDFDDISPFINLLATDGYQVDADFNQDQSVDFDDIAPFIILLSN